jgi:hypothetical protein
MFKIWGVAGCFCTSISQHAGITSYSTQGWSIASHFFFLEKQNYSLRSETCQRLDSSRRGCHYFSSWSRRISEMTVSVVQVKITDFGLSKVMSEEEHEGGGMELTSQVSTAVFS